CARDKPGNRELHMDEYCLGVLLFLFNPLVTSLRAIQQATGFANVQKKLGIKRASLGSLSESVSVFDPEPLKEIATQLAAQVPVGQGADFSAIHQRITAVDGSVFDTVARVAELAWVPLANGKHKHAYRLHTHFEVLRGVPSRIDVTSANPKGDADERAVLQRTIESDRCYVTDRGYAKFALWNAIVDKGSSYVCRSRDNSAYEIVEELQLSSEDIAEGVLSDQIVELGKDRTEANRPNHKVRIVIVESSPHTSRGKYRGGSTGPSSDGKLRIATNLLDVPAELISKIYRLRWLIELFFRMFKGLFGCRHLLSTKQNGVEIQAYMAIIACLLILIYTGVHPNKRLYEAICFYLLGWAELEELEAIIEKQRAANQKKS
ncbi:MAG: IS4 family transposase, partial [Anaerolineales bacterium]|nr:IS4 family transposase [Anaerolineales bacterium]